MMSRKFLIASVLLVVSYCCVHYVGVEEENRNNMLNEVLKYIIQNEVNTKHVLADAINEESKKKSDLAILSKKLMVEADLILSLSDKPSYKHTDYISKLFDKYGIDNNTFAMDLSQPMQKYRLYNSINKYLENYLVLLSKNTNDLEYLEFEIIDMHDTFRINELYKLDFRFYEKHLYGTAKKYFYETNGKKIRIENIPLTLDHLPEDIVFSVSMEDIVTGEMSTIKSKLRPYNYE